MKCHHCDKQATVHLTQILNGQMHKMDLCESCLREGGDQPRESLHRQLDGAGWGR